MSDLAIRLGLPDELVETHIGYVEASPRDGRYVFAAMFFVAFDIDMLGDFAFVAQELTRRFEAGDRRGWVPLAGDNGPGRRQAARLPKLVASVVLAETAAGGWVPDGSPSIRIPPSEETP